MPQPAAPSRGRQGQRRSSSLAPACAALLALAAAASHLAAAFAGGPAKRQRGASAIQRAASSWQERLDKALLDVDAAPQARLQNLQEVLLDPGAVLSDVGKAVSAIREKGFKDGHVEAIDRLWPQGTIARSDIEGLQALRRQIPEIVQDLQNLGPSSVPDVESRPSAAARPGLGDLASGVLSLATDDRKREEAVQEAGNIFRQVPTGLETPSYEVVQVLGSGSRALEVRRYEPFTVARRSMPNGNGTGFASGQGFTRLADYLFGNNSQSVAMEMTMPVEISYDGSDEAAMAFVLPTAYADAPPLSSGDDIDVVRVPERLVAVKAFPGVVTEGEVQRQRQALSEILDEAALYRQANATEYSVLQYNPPYTVPWRRLNELAVVVSAVEAPRAAAEGPAAPEPQSPGSSRLPESDLAPTAAAEQTTGPATPKKAADVAPEVGSFDDDGL